MFNSQKNYIIKQSSGEIWNFYYNNENGILYRKFQNDNYSFSKIAAKEGANNFTSLISDDDKIILLYEDICGNLILSKFINDDWVPEILMKRKSGSLSSIFFDAVIIKDSLHIIYCIPNEDSKKYALIHQTSHFGERLKQPIVVDILNSLHGKPFNIYSNDNELFLIYKNLNEHWSLCCRCYSQVQNEWGATSIIDTSKKPFKELSFAEDENSKRVAYIKSGEKDTILLYSIESSLLNSPKIIFQSNKIDDCSIFIIDEQIWINWVSNKKISSAFSIDNGENFNLVENNAELKVQIKKTRFISKNKDLNLHLNVNDLFIEDSNSLKIYTVPELYSDISNNNNLSIENNILKNTTITINEYNSKILLYEKQIFEYKEKIENLNTLISKYINSYETLKKTNSEISAKYSTFLCDSKKLSTPLLESQEQLVSKQLRIVALEKQLVSIQEISLNFQSKNAILKSEKDILNLLCNDYNNEIVKLQNENTILTESLEEKKFQLGKAKEPLIKRFFGTGQ